MRSKTKGLLTSLILAASVFLACVNVSAADTTEAREAVETDRVSSLTVQYDYDDKPIEGIQVFLYKVADVDRAYQFTLRDPYSQYGLELNQVKTDSEWAEKTKVLEQAVSENLIVPDAIQKTDAEGEVHFQNISTGMYLVMSLNMQVTNGSYKYESALVSVPTVNEDGSLQYNVTCCPKGVFVKIDQPKTDTQDKTNKASVPKTEDGQAGILVASAITLAAALSSIILLTAIRKKRRMR